MRSTRYALQWEVGCKAVLPMKNRAMYKNQLAAASRKNMPYGRTRVISRLLVQLGDCCEAVCSELPQLDRRPWLPAGLVLTIVHIASTSPLKGCKERECALFVTDALNICWQNHLEHTV